MTYGLERWTVYADLSVLFWYHEYEIQKRHSRGCRKSSSWHCLCYCLSSTTWWANKWRAEDDHHLSMLVRCSLTMTSISITSDVTNASCDVTFMTLLYVTNDKLYYPRFNRKWQDYVYIQCEYKSTKQKIKHLLREEIKVKENKIS